LNTTVLYIFGVKFYLFIYLLHFQVSDLSSDSEDDIPLSKTKAAQSKEVVTTKASKAKKVNYIEIYIYQVVIIFRRQETKLALNYRLSGCMSSLLQALKAGLFKLAFYISLLCLAIFRSRFQLTGFRPVNSTVLESLLKPTGIF
jgi:hypothetical protein